MNTETPTIIPTITVTAPEAKAPTEVDADELQRIGVSLDAGTITWLNAEGRATDRSRSSVIRQLVACEIARRAKAAKSQAKSQAKP